MNQNADEMRRLPPYNNDAERAVLGACMLDKNAANNVLPLVKPEDFFSQSHQLIFRCMLRMIDAGEPCDPVILGEALSLQGDLERVGGMAYLSGLLDSVPAPASAPYYANIVAEKSLVRALLDAVSVITNNGYDGNLHASEQLELAEKLIFDISQGRRGSELFSLAGLLPDVYVLMSNIKAAGGVTGVPTFKDLDMRYLSGLQKGDLILLAARPGMGKSSMALNIAQQAASRYGKVAAVFSLEMPKEQLVQRMLCTEAQVDYSRVRKGLASKSDFSRLKKAVNKLSGAQLFIDDTMSVTVTEMRSKCRKLKLERGLDLVVVDYIQLMQATPGRKVENRQLEVAEISRSLKAMAKELDVPVLALSQLSRQAETGKEAPGLAHLRESGALEQDADVVLLLHRPKPGENEAAGEQWKYDKSNDGEIMDVIVAKHRNGQTGPVQMVFIRPYTLFSDLAQNWAGDEAPPPSAADLEESEVF